MPRFESSPIPHRPQIDALRCFAVAPVLAVHFLYETGAIALAVAARVGVWLFFVISGFLITEILLRCRESDRSISSNLGRFYLRRFLRIFPLYYGVLAFLFLSDVAGFRENIFMFLTYTQNFLFIADGFTEQGGHFWSLAVEEQFYLVWPILILTIPRRRLLSVVVLVALLGPAWRVLGSLLNWSERGSYLSPIAALDTLGLGAMLAIGVHWYSAVVPVWVKRLGFASAVSALVAIVSLFQNLPVKEFSVDLTITLACGWLVYGAYIGFTGFPGRILDLKPLVYLGTISYGLYVLHGFAPYFFSLVGLHVAKTNPLIYSLTLTIATIGCAALSWHLYERPINDLKRFFPYKVKALRATAPTGHPRTVGSSEAPN